MDLSTVLWGNTYTQYIVLIAAIIIGIGFGKLAYWVSTTIIKKITAKTKTQLDDILVEHLEKPVLFAIFMAALFYGIKQLTFSSAGHLFVNKVFLVILVISATWVITNIIDALLIAYIHPLTEKSKTDLDDHLMPIVRRLVKIVIWIIVLIMLIRNFGVDVSALLAGVGLGGLAFALAAQDLLSNLFGGMAILTDKPFRLGDRIRVGQNEGFVREIGMRTTRIETLDGTQLIIPNAEIAKSVLENVSREKARKVKLNIGLNYSTSQKKIVEAQKIIKDIVVKHELTENESNAALVEFGESSLVLSIIYWIKEKNRDQLMDIKNEINLAIKEKFERAGIEMAFPTRTVHIVQDKKRR